MSYSVVWFKRDLRVHDNAPLAAAAALGPVLCLYVVEPSVWTSPDAATQHLHWAQECLADLSDELASRGAHLQIATGEVVDVLERLRAAAPFHALFAHEETGNGITYARDRAVARWARASGVAFHEYPAFGVVRGLLVRERFQARWEQRMGTALVPMPERLMGRSLPWIEPPPPQAHALGLTDPDPPQRQRGGRTNGLAVLNEFLLERSAQYRGGISSPLSAPNACSRLSPHLALGTLSLREVVQATRQQKQVLPLDAKRQRLGLDAFISRLVWHCHFIQKLESEPELEWRNLHRGYDGLREDDGNPAHFEALVQGRTGWPMVDACVAMLRETGWLNFRMRAMLVSVAAYPLWLHWRPVGLWLARQFLDYEPGIHWSQLQMQSGTTGINATRVYNPVKQARDHDPHGHFVRRWLPAMRRVPDAWLFEPWRMPPEMQARCGLRPGDLPQPLVDLELATRQAKARLHERRGLPEVRAAVATVVQRHASRKRPDGSDRAPARRRAAPAADAAQASLF
jgi:deoxyribodipyrimidine photo-lyase